MSVGSLSQSSTVCVQLASSGPVMFHAQYSAVSLGVSTLGFHATLWLIGVGAGKARQPLVW